MINTIIGKYKITRLIGEGGMASVYEAEHEMLGTKVAIKVLNPILSANAQIKERFRNEARLMASLDHPNITKVIDFDEQPQQLSIVMEYLNGEDLNQKIKRNGPLSEKEITDVFSQTLSAFQYAHEKGIVHRDIKPSNIFILPNGHVKILDFGIAKLFGQGNEMTQTGTQLGTPIYMSPEQVKADKSIDHRSDIYSLGVTLFFAINGKPPYNSDTDSQFDIFNKIVYESLPELTGTSYLNELIKKACNKNRDRRFQYCKEWIDAFNNKEVSVTQTANKTVVELPALDKTIAETTSAPMADKTVIETTSHDTDKTTGEPQSRHEDNQILKKESSTPEKSKNNKVLLFSIVGVVAIAIIVGGGLFFGSSNENQENKKKSASSNNKKSDEKTINNLYKNDTISKVNRVVSSEIQKVPDVSKQYTYLITNKQYEEFAKYNPDVYYDVKVDGKKYTYSNKIKLNIGKHIITETLRDKIDGTPGCSDEIEVTLTDKNFNIIVDFNSCACPFFYYVQNLTCHYGGELIRNLNSKKKEGLDYFELDKHFINSDTLYLLIKEEKDETSFLDEIYLKINDSLLVLPKSDNAIINSNILFRDGKYQILKQGSDFEIYFVIPSSIFIESVKIYSYGYYLKNHR